MVKPQRSRNGEPCLESHHWETDICLNHCKFKQVSSSNSNPSSRRVEPGSEIAGHRNKHKAGEGGNPAILCEWPARRKTHENSTYPVWPEKLAGWELTTVCFSISMTSQTNFLKYTIYHHMRPQSLTLQWHTSSNKARPNSADPRELIGEGTIFFQTSTPRQLIKQFVLAYGPRRTRVHHSRKTQQQVTWQQKHKAENSHLQPKAQCKLEVWRL